MNSHFYALLSRMKYINRWALMRNTSGESLSQHSQEVASVVYALCVIGNRRFGKNYNSERASLLGLFHDVPEILTGDMPTPVKYFNSEIRTAYKDVEEKASDKLLLSVPEDLRENFDFILKPREEDKDLWRLVKAADKISALIKCIEERKAGNTEFAKAETSTLEAIKTLDCPEAEDFIKEFLPSYELTLDQIS